MDQTEYDAGPGRKIAVYAPMDTGSEIDASWIFEQIAADAAGRATRGWRIISMTVVPQRHSAAFIAREGSGFESKISVAVLYSAVGMD